MPDDAIHVVFRESLNPPWTDLSPVRAGARVGTSTPAVYVTAERDFAPLLRIDLYESEPAAHAFQQAIAWNGLIAIGFGGEVHLVSPASRSSSTVRLSGYFGSLYPLSALLLVADADSLRCFNSRGEQVWRSEPLGVDGVLVSDVEEGVITGRGDWDPPGDWRPFRISLASGRAC